MKKKNQKPKPTSVRLDQKLLEDMDERCNELGCSRNEFIRSVVEFSVYEDDSMESDEEEPKVIKVEDVKEFDCKDGSLYANGSFYGKCSDFDMNKGKVYAKNGKYLGKIIPHATIEIID